MKVFVALVVLGMIGTLAKPIIDGNRTCAEHKLAQCPDFFK